MTSPPPLEFLNAAPGRKKFTVGVAAVAPHTIWHARPGVVAALAERLVRWWGAASAIHFLFLNLFLAFGNPFLGGVSPWKSSQKMVFHGMGMLLTFTNSIFSCENQDPYTHRS